MAFTKKDFLDFWNSQACSNRDSCSKSTLEKDPEEALFREVAEKRHLRKILQFTRSMNILDLGCGTGRFSKMFSRHCKSVTGVDFSPEMIRIARKKNLQNACFINADAVSYQSDEKFDLIFIGGLFPYISENEIQSVILNISEMLSPGGTLILRESLSLLSHNTQKEFYFSDTPSKYYALYRTEENLLSEFSGFDVLYSQCTYSYPFCPRLFSKLPKFFYKHPAVKKIVRILCFSSAFFDWYLLKIPQILSFKKERLLKSPKPTTQKYFVLKKPDYAYIEKSVFS